MRNRAESIVVVVGCAVVGWLLASAMNPLFGLLVGGLAGWVLNRLNASSGKPAELEELRRSLSNLRSRVVSLERQGEPDAKVGEASPPPSPTPGPVPVSPHPPSKAPPPAAPTVSTPNPIRQAFAVARGWLFTGNVPVKVGVTVISFGIVFFLMLAAEKGWFRFPIEARLLAVDVGAAAMLALGWRLRSRMRVYALTLQGGAVGILFLDIFVAYRVYGLIPSALTFSLLVALAVFAGLLAVRQDASVLAVMGSAGAFLAPLLTMSVEGQPAALFGYYAVLDLAIFGIAFFRAWRSLNLLGFLFTYVIGWVWAARYYRPELLSSVLPFVVLFFLLFVGVAVLYAFRRATRFDDHVDAPIVFGTPIFTFAALAAMLRESEYGLSLCAATAALVYLALAWLLRRRSEAGHRRLVQAFVSLGAALGTLSIPLAFDARWTSALWALEAAALVWFGLRQRQRLTWVAGIVLHVAAGAAFLVGDLGESVDPLPVLNADYLGTALLAVSALFAAYHLRGARLVVWIGLAAWGGLWWFGGGSYEVMEHVRPSRFVLAGLTLFWSGSVAVGVALSRRLSWPGLGTPIFALLPFLGLLVLAGELANDHPLGARGWIAWPLALMLLYGSLHRLESSYPRSLPFLHAPALWLIASLASFEVGWLGDRAQASPLWEGVAVALVPALLILFVRYFPFAWPVPPHRWIFAVIACAPLVVQLGLLVIALNLTPADPSPLPYLPLLNPLDAMGALTIFVLWIFLPDLLGRQAIADPRIGRGSLALAVLSLSTATIVRTVHHWAGVPFARRPLMESVVLHASLSLFWGALGLSAMIYGARKLKRWVWIMGALLMSVVVLKLFIIDLGNSGTVARVVSFIGVGLLLLVVGYFAGVPPSDRPETTSAPPSTR